MTTSQQSRLGTAPEEGIKAPVAAVASGNLALFDTGMTIAGYVVLDHDRICAAAQTDSTENGIYVARGGKTWERATDMNESDDVADGQLMSDANTSAVYNINLSAGAPWSVGVDTITFGLLLTPVGFFWGAITGTLSDQADLQAELDAKSDVGHTHLEADITDLQAYLTDAAGSIAMDGEIYARQNSAWIVVDTSLFAPAVHTHLEADITDLQPYLLDAPSNDELYARVNGTWQGFSVASGTTGEIIAWPDDELPQNFLWCDGVSHNAVTFSDLFAVLGYKYGGSGANFNVPDLRGTFIRGTANGSGQDPDRTSRTDRGDGTTGDAVGTKQSYEIQAHRHSVNVRVDPDSDTEGGGGDPRPDFGPLLTSNTGGSETRPRNIGMNYIIRYTGGGSGITQPPSIEVQDSGVPLTTAVQLLNFINFNLEQPITDQIDITFGSSRTSGEYCPGYDPVFVNTTQWRIDGIDVTNSYRAGRRLRFIDGAANYYGTITSSSFGGGNTTIFMSMDTGLLTAGISEVCFTTSATAWSPISADPFAGNSINDITVGTIGAQPYVFAVGNGGRAGYSMDGGLNWTMLSTGTTEHLKVCTFDSNTEVFWAAGLAGVLVNWDGSSVTLDTTSIPGLAGTFTYDINGLSFSSNEGALIIIFANASAGWATASSTDQGGTWTVRDPSETGIGQNKNLHAFTTSAGDTGPGFQIAKSNNTGIRIYSTHDDTAASNGGSSTPNGQVRNFPFWDVSLGYLIADTTNRILAGGGQWTAIDDVNITELVTDFAYSPFHDRMVLCGENGQLAYWDGSKKTVVDSWVQVASGFDPLVTINALVWDGVGGNFIAVSANGQICRSSTGLGDTVTAPTESGFTLIAADPFGGAPITHIRAGAIAGQVYWIACGGSLMFRSIDAGVTWSAITHGASGTVVSLTYSSATETFVAGFSAGDLSYTEDGSTTWVADTTTIAALGLGTRVLNIHYFDDTSTWLIMIPDGATLTRTFTAPDITAAVWTVLDTSISNPQEPNMIWDDFGTDRVFWQDTTQGIPYFANGNDTTSQNLVTISALPIPRTALHVAAGTDGHPYDIMIGNSNGDVCFFGIAINVELSILPGNVNGFALSTVANRYVVVGDSGAIYTQLESTVDNTGNWIEVVNPFTSHINAVWYDPSDDIIIAVGVNGEIGRSVDGIS